MWSGRGRQDSFQPVSTLPGKGLPGWPGWRCRRALSFGLFATMIHPEMESAQLPEIDKPGHPVGTSYGPTHSPLLHPVGYELVYVGFYSTQSSHTIASRDQTVIPQTMGIGPELPSQLGNALC